MSKGDVPKLISVLDIEASGIHKNSYPIEIGFVLADGQSYCTLIQPAPGWSHWDTKAERLHGIEREKLLQFGKPVLQVATELNELLRGLTLYSDCAGLDEKWLMTLFSEANRYPSFKLRDLMYLLPEDEYAQWIPAKRGVEKGMNIERHRASSDAKVLQKTYEAIKKSRA